MPAHEYYHNWNLRNRDLAQTLEHYVMRGFTPGGFITAVLANDLYNAVGRADSWNRPAIAEITQEVLHTCPTHARGSYEAVEAWLDDADNRRSQYATWKILQGTVEQSEHNDIPF